MSPNVNDLKDSRFLTKHDVEPDKLVTIKSYEKADVSMQSQPSKIKWTLSFEELDKSMVLNATNGQLMAMIARDVYGVSIDVTEDEDGSLCPTNQQFRNWIGKQVILYNDKTVSFGNEMTGGIRIKAPKVQQ